MGESSPGVTSARVRVSSSHRPRRQAAWLRRWLADWGVVLPFAVLAGGLLVAPAVNIALDSVRAAGGGYTLQNWGDVFALGLTRRSITTSLTLSTVVATLSVLIGTPLAWALSRLGLGGRSLAAAALNVAANIPATSLVFGFTAAFGGAGLITLLAQQLWPGAPALDLYGPGGLVLVYLYFHVPLFVLLMLPATGAVSERLWEAAAVAGAAPALFWRRVGLPILTPFLLAGWLLMFVWALGAYGVPLALGGTDARIELITLRIGALVQSAGSTNRFERAACLSILLVALSVAALWIYQSTLRRAARWQT
jgi:putative spermidine/putrescine transport system permease protein